MKIKIIAAVGQNNAIGGEGGKIPWSFHPEDMKIFSGKTKSEGATVLMGRKTFLTLPEKFRPLPQRKNVILTRDETWHPVGTEVFTSKEAALEALSQENVETFWVCGGADIYRQFIDEAEELHISHFDVRPEKAVAFFPVIDHTLWKEVESKACPGQGEAPSFIHRVYTRK